MVHEVHPVCLQLRNLRHAARLSLQQAQELTGVSAVVLGSYERGDRMPSVAKVDDLLKNYGYRLAAVPVDFDAVRLPSDIANELRAIADQIEKDKLHDVPQLPAAQSLVR